MPAEKPKEVIQMKDRNETLLVGTIFGEPRFSQTKNGGTCASFTVAVKRPDPSKTKDLINVTAWNDMAYRLALEFGPDRRILVRGSIHRTSYVSADGARRNFTKINADILEHPDETVEVPVTEETAHEYGYSA